MSRLFMERGYMGTPMADVSQAVGGSKATLYAYFPSKEALFRSFMEMRMTSEAENLFVFPIDKETPETVLENFGMRFLRMATRKDSQALLRLLYAESPHFPELGAAFYNVCHLNGRRRLMSCLMVLSERGALKSLPDPVPAAEQCLSFCQSGFIMDLMLRVGNGGSRVLAIERAKAAEAAFPAGHRRKKKVPEHEVRSLTKVKKCRKHLP